MRNPWDKMIKDTVRTGVAAAVTVAGIFAVYKCTIGRSVSADTTFLMEETVATTVAESTPAPSETSIAEPAESTEDTSAPAAPTAPSESDNNNDTSSSDNEENDSVPAPDETETEPADTAKDPTIGKYIYDLGMFWIPGFDEFYQFGNNYEVGLLLPKSQKIFDIDKGEEDDTGYGEYTIHYGNKVFSLKADCILDTAIIERDSNSAYLIIIIGTGGDVETTLVYEMNDASVKVIEQYDHAHYNFSHLK